ncbi:MAG: HEAT repeat domain-containing protein [Gemmatimonadaceae bacterium]|nr:HEAT repeat domain-containing protein [Gemmatimonadaceae bacterium]
MTDRITPSQAGRRPLGASLRRSFAALLPPVFLLACGPDIEGAIDDLGDPSRHDDARQQLLLAKELAVDALLGALEDPGRSPVRADLVDVLASMDLRVEDPRIEAALKEHLVNDPDSRVRARIAWSAGLHRRRAFLDPLLESGLSDPHGDVVHQALIAIDALDDRMSPEQSDGRFRKTAELISHPHPEVAREARIFLADHAGALVDEGRALQIQARVAEAESLYTRALEIVPGGRYATYRLARMHFDAGRRDQGLNMLRRNGMLLDVPRVSGTIVADGRLDEPLWSAAASASDFWVFVFAHKAAFPSPVASEIRLARSDDALFIGFVGYDESPDSLVVNTREEDGQIWWEDVLEIFLDASLDHRSYIHMGVNSIGVRADASHADGLQSKDMTWDADAEVGAFVSDDAWSAEVVLRFGEPWLPRPGPGDVWGANFVRSHRGADYSQWVRTFVGGGHAPDEFGFLVFR